jgi:ribosomal protein S18 acetylase RimI-like enzyme
MRNEIEIRRATKEDLKSFYPFFRKSITSQFPEYSSNTTRFFTEEEFSEKQLTEQIERGNKIVFIASLKNEIIGFITGQPLYGGVGLAEWLAVDEAYHNMGIGKELLKTWEEYVLQDGGHKVHLWSAEKNIHFYENRGYTVVGRIPENWFGAEDFLLYKSLQKATEDNYLRKFLNKKEK